VAERAVTRRWFEGSSSRERIARELAAANDFERTAFSPKQRGTRWFFARNTGHQNQPVLVVADSLLGEPRVVADFNEISPEVAFDDFIAAAEWLIAQQITSAGKLAIAGASNGGLLVAAVAVQRPELFGAVVVKVGVLDMLRFPLTGQGAGWQGVYGSPDVAEEFRALRAYSPVHNVKPARYPAMLVVTGENETRVAPWHSFKLVAALQAAQRAAAPILLYLERDAGHFGAVTESARWSNEAAALGFIRRALDASLP
jgi:prolyl oligopeptidase